MLRNKKRWLFAVALLAASSVPSYAAQIRTHSYSSIRNVCMLHDTEWDPNIVARPPILESPMDVESGQIDSGLPSTFSDCPNDSDSRSGNFEYTFTSLPADEEFPATSFDCELEGDTFADSNPYNNLSQAFIETRSFEQARISQVSPMEEGVPPAPSIQNNYPSESISICTPPFSKSMSGASEEYLPYDVYTSKNWLGSELEMNISEAAASDIFDSIETSYQDAMSIDCELSMDSEETQAIDSDATMASQMDEGCFSSAKSSCPSEAFLTSTGSSNSNFCPFTAREEFSNLFSPSRIEQAQQSFSSAIMGWNSSMSKITETIVATTNAYDFAENIPSDNMDQLCDPHVNMDRVDEDMPIATPVDVRVQADSIDTEMRFVSTPVSSSMLGNASKLLTQTLSIRFNQIGNWFIDLSRALSDLTEIR